MLEILAHFGIGYLELFALLSVILIIIGLWFIGSVKRASHTNDACGQDKHAADRRTHGYVVGYHDDIDF